MNRRIDQYIAKYEELEELNSDKNDENDEFIKEIKALTIEFSSSFSFLEKILNAEIFISSLNQWKISNWWILISLIDHSVIILSTFIQIWIINIQMIKSSLIFKSVWRKSLSFFIQIWRTLISIYLHTSWSSMTTSLKNFMRWWLIRTLRQNQLLNMINI